eukprot:TRINITY_DN88_c0_g1_i4.p1 TRINITY_DN88_c0_g1~~TRINITY_DN88_c0_g1_i4.p1  ORF type:complete len:198 (+),score=22.00 TRINITY_DN88_c0_g1_i4:67-660(+)
MLGKLHSAKLHDRSNDDDADSLLPISCAAQSMQTVLTSAHTQLNLFTAAHHAQDGQVKNWQRVTDFADEFQLFVQKIKEEQKSRPELIKMYMCFLELSSSIKFALHYAQHTHKMNLYPPLNTTATPFLQPCHPSDQQVDRCPKFMKYLKCKKLASCFPSFVVNGVLIFVSLLFPVTVFVFHSAFLFLLSKGLCPTFP